MLFISYNQLCPDNPSLKMYKRPLKDITFPITLKFCIRELENASARYQKYGYCNSWPFYLGQRCYGGNIYGWNGHTRNGSTITTVKGTSSGIPVLSKFALHINQDMLDDISFDWEGILDAIILLTPDGKESWCWVLHKIKSLML